MRKQIIRLAATVILGAIISALLPCRAIGAELKLMSFNIRMGIADDKENSWPKRCDALAEMLLEEKPDCFGVQEAFSFQREYILKRMPSYKAIGRGRNDGGDKGEHMCVFWNTDRFDLVDGGDFWLSTTPDVPSKGWDAKYPRIATWVLLNDILENRKFYLVNTHFDHVGIIARRESMNLICNRIASINPEGLPIAVMGDFNLPDGDPVIQYFNGIMSNARDVSAVSDHKPSFNGWGDPKKESVIDYIYFSGFKGASLFRTVTGKWLGRSLISDHNPIYTVLTY